MSKLDDLTKEVSQSYGAKGYAIDPMTLLFIAGLILDLVKIVMACYDKTNYDGAVKRINNPSLYDRVLLKRRIKAYISKNGSDMDVNAIRDACLNIKLKPEEFSELTQEVSNRKE